ncbi:C39 family peptidase [bacterium]|nr:C39 family peptidase [bacterium]
MDAHVRPFSILPQPDETSCGPTCLHAVYRHFGDDHPLTDITEEIRWLSSGGTLAVFLGCHALSRGYRATIHTFNMDVFDPTWFTSGADLAAKLRAQLLAKRRAKMRVVTEGFLEFLRLGGQVVFEDLTTRLLRRYLAKATPVIAGLSATYLYREAREEPLSGREDDIRGEPVGHFVVLCGYRPETREVTVADPLRDNPYSDTHMYDIHIERVLGAILLGTLTHDDHLLILAPPAAPVRS